MSTLTQIKRLIESGHYQFTDKALNEWSRDGLTTFSFLLKKMSLSKTKNRTEAPGFVILPCPTCGMPAMEPKEGKHQLEDGTIVPNVRWLECPDCGEKLFDPENARIVVSYGKPIKRSRSRRVSVSVKYG